MKKTVRITICKGRRPALCRRNLSCKMAVGPKRSFCRKKSGKSSGSCKGMRASSCRQRKSCKMAFGKKRSFCRKKTNKKRERFYTA